MTTPSPLHQQICEPCREGARPLSPAEARELLPATPAWQIVEIDTILRLRRAFPFETVPDLLAFQAKIMAAADEQGHHPLLVVSPTRRGWRLLIDQWTHKIPGLHANDFIMAAKFDRIAGA
jgi:4a-hydroxytetrahydrobiopterin dehydratase